MQILTAGATETLQPPGGGEKKSNGTVDTHQSESQEPAEGSTSGRGSFTAISRSGS